MNAARTWCNGDAEPSPRVPVRDADGFVWQPEHHGYRCTCGQCPGIDICHWDHVLSCYGPLTEVRVQS